VSGLELDRPVVILGAARSGTTLVGDLLSRHPDLAYWVEPKYVWQYGRPAAPDDVRTAREATPRIRAYIRSRFAQYVAARPGARFAEKTPSNCFRVPFVEAVLPDARYLHIVRDGRDAVFSALQKWSSPPVPDAMVRRLTSFEIPLRDLPSYGLQAARRVLRNPWTRSEWAVWGPRYPGISEDRARLPLLEVCATQWARSVAALRRDLARIPDERVVNVRFEELVADPGAVLGPVLRGLDLPAAPQLLRTARDQVRPERASSWTEHDPAELDRVVRIIGSELEELGYE